MPTTQLKYKLNFLENLHTQKKKKTNKRVASSSKIIVISSCKMLFMIKWVVYNAERRMEEECITLIYIGNSKDT